MFPNSFGGKPVAEVVGKDCDTCRLSQLVSLQLHDALSWGEQAIAVPLMTSHFIVFGANALPFVNDIIENLFEGREVVVKADGGEFADQCRVLIFFRPLVPDHVFKLRQFFLFQVVFVDLKPLACLAETRRVNVKLETLDLSKLRKWNEPVVGAELVSGARLHPFHGAVVHSVPR